MSCTTHGASFGKTTAVIIHRTRSACPRVVEDKDIAHAVDNALVVADLDDDDAPIHAMKMTDQYRWMLPTPPEPMT